MSSYLTFYIVPKAKNDVEIDPIAIMSYSRNSDVYQSFRDNLNVAYIGMDDKPNYSELTTKKVDIVIADLNKDIKSAQDRIAEYEKHAAGNFEIIDEILSQKDYISDLEYALHKIEFIRDLVEEAENEWSNLKAIYCNVD